MNVSRFEKTALTFGRLPMSRSCEMNKVNRVVMRSSLATSPSGDSSGKKSSSAKRSSMPFSPMLRWGWRSSTKTFASSGSMSPFAQLNGLDSRDQVGKPLRDVIADLSSRLSRSFARLPAPVSRCSTRKSRGPYRPRPGVTGWWLKSLFPIAKDGDVVTQMGIVVQDITGLKRAETAVRRLSGRLLQIRDDERRRLARDLHDSLGQTLTAVKMNLSYLGRDTSNLDERGRNAVTESKELIDNSLKEVRTLSHLLHPPMLDDVGLVAAIRWFANGFSRAKLHSS